MEINLDIIYKESIMNILLSILELAGRENKYSQQFEFESDYKKWLKFQKETDWKRYRASVDLLVDTDYAIINTFEYQLSDINAKNKDYGEIYLRLYGVLNAVYFQIGAYNMIANLLNFPGRNQIKSKFKSLNIYKLRNMAGSHTIDYIYSEEERKIQEFNINQKTSFRIIQSNLDQIGQNIVTIDENNLTYKFDLLEILSEYDNYSKTVLIELIQHMIDSVVRNKVDKLLLRERLNELLSKLIDYSTLNKNRKSKAINH